MNAKPVTPPPRQAPGCTLRVPELELGTTRPCRNRGRTIVVLAGVVTVRCGPVCGPHLRAVYAAHGHLIDHLEYAPTDSLSPKD